jgi:hypothetical protein
VDGRFCDQNFWLSLSVAVLFAAPKERLQLLCGWERETVAVFSSRTKFLEYGKVKMVEMSSEWY